MTTRNLSASLTMPQRFRLSELDRSRSTASQQNRLRAVLEVRLRQLEHDRRTALAGITRAQRKIQQQSVATINRSIQAFLRLITTGTVWSSKTNHQTMTTTKRHRHASATVVAADCVPARTDPQICYRCHLRHVVGRLRRSVTVVPVVKSRFITADRITSVRYYDNDCENTTAKPFTVGLSLGTVHRSTTTI